MQAQETMLERFAAPIAALPPAPSFTEAQLLTPTFKLHQEGRLSIYYAPFDYINTAARVTIVGITPGFQQMEIAYREMRAGLRRGLSEEEAGQRAKAQASFAGTMRQNLLAMLNGIGLPSALGLGDSAALFGNRKELLHTTSAVRYPVFVNDRNYTGHSPALLRSPLLLRYVQEVLLPELVSVKDALIVPLGKSVSEVLHLFIASGALDERHCLIGFPHPSGGNGHRVRQYAELRGDLSKKIRSWAYNKDQ